MIPVVIVLGLVIYLLDQVTGGRLARMPFTDLLSGALAVALVLWLLWRMTQ